MFFIHIVSLMLVLVSLHCI